MKSRFVVCYIKLRCYMIIFGGGIDKRADRKSKVHVKHRKKIELRVGYATNISHYLNQTQWQNSPLSWKPFTLLLCMKCKHLIIRPSFWYLHLILGKCHSLLFVPMIYLCLCIWLTQTYKHNIFSVSYILWKKYNKVKL